MTVRSLLKEAFFDGPSPICYTVLEEDGMYENGDKEVSLEQHSGYVKTFLDKFNERRWCTVRVDSSVHIFAAIFNNFLPRCAVDTLNVCTGHGMFLPGTVYRRSVSWEECEDEFGRRRANPCFQDFYNTSIIVDWKFLDQSAVFGEMHF